jgi:hypothetical protein
MQLEFKDNRPIEICSYEAIKDKSKIEITGSKWTMILSIDDILPRIVLRPVVQMDFY